MWARASKRSTHRPDLDYEGRRMLALPYSARRLILQRSHGLGVALALILTSACGTSPSEQSAIADLPVQPSDTPLPSPVPTTDPSDYTQCGWKWNTRPLPDLTDEVQAGLDAAGIQGATAIVYAFGEDCFDPQTGTVLRFATLETDIDITLEVANLGGSRGAWESGGAGARGA